MPIASSIPIQLQVTTRSNPPVPPMDMNTGEWPAIFKGGDVAFNTGIFNAAGFPVDLSNLATLTLNVYPYTPPQNYLGYPLEDVVEPVATVNVGADDITPLITFAQWEAGLVQNCTFLLSGEVSQAFDLQGQPSNKFTITVRGAKSAGGNIVYGSGPLMVYESGINGSGPTPPTSEFTGTVQLSNATGDTVITLDAGIIFLTAFVEITGSAGTRNIVLSTSHAIDGAKITVVASFPETGGISIQARSGSLDNPVIAGSLTESDGSGDGVTLDFVFDGTDWRRVIGLYSN